MGLSLPAPMDEEIKKKFEQQSAQLDAISRTLQTMRKYARWRLIITIAVIVLPFIGLIFVIPAFLKAYNFSALGIPQ